MCVVSSCLGASHFTVFPPLVKEPKTLTFAAGQPLGYYSSWALFALSHHVIVWLAAERVYPGPSKFMAYAILGDDIVIGDARVAAEYKNILSSLQVSISESNSLISETGAL